MKVSLDILMLVVAIPPCIISIIQIVKLLIE